MLYNMENGLLSVTVSTFGAELQDIHTLGAPSVPCLWDGKAGIWPRLAPVCFPWCGRVEGG